MLPTEENDTRTDKSSLSLSLFRMSLSKTLVVVCNQNCIRTHTTVVGSWTHLCYNLKRTERGAHDSLFWYWYTYWQLSTPPCHNLKRREAGAGDKYISSCQTRSVEKQNVSCRSKCKAKTRRLKESNAAPSSKTLISDRKIAGIKRTGPTTPVATNHSEGFLGFPGNTVT